MSIKVAAWNIGRGLSDSSENRSHLVIDGIDRLDSDVVVLSEAFDQHGPAVDSSTWSLRGYSQLNVPYERSNNKPGQETYLSVLSRVRSALAPARLGVRNAVKMFVYDEVEGIELQGYGIHMDDESESNRITMAGHLLAPMSLGHETLSFIAGDMNAMREHDPKSIVLRNRFMRFAAEILPNDRAKSLATRLCDMADGQTMSMIMGAGFEEVAPDTKSTFVYTGLAFGQLDHILKTPDLRAEDFTVHDLVCGFDHKAVSTTLQIA